MKTQILVLATAIFIGGCSDPMATKLSSDPAQWAQEISSIQNKLSDDDKRLLIGYMTRATLAKSISGNPLQDQATTVGDALKQQKKWAEDARLRDEEERQKLAIEKQEQAKAKALLKEAVSADLSYVKLISRSQTGIIKDQVIGVLLKNKTDKAISGVSGVITVVNQFGSEVGRVSFEISEDIPPQGEAKWEGSRYFNEHMKEHTALLDIDRTKNTIDFTPRMIVFADGTKLGSSD